MQFVTGSRSFIRISPAACSQQAGKGGPTAEQASRDGRLLIIQGRRSVDISGGGCSAPELQSSNSIFDIAAIHQQLRGEAAEALRRTYTFTSGDAVCHVSPLLSRKYDLQQCNEQVVVSVTNRVGARSLLMLVYVVCLLHAQLLLLLGTCMHVCIDGWPTHQAGCHRHAA